MVEREITHKLLQRVRRQKRVLFFILIILVLAGSFFIFHTWNRNVAKRKSDILETGKTIAYAINGVSAAQLNAEPSDINTQAYHSIKNRLMHIKNEFSKAQFIYLYKQKEGKLYFIADSEPENSENCSPAGQYYEEADEESFLPFKTGQSIVTQPAEDRWGNWISVLVPLRDQSNGEIFAVLGIDYPENEFYNEAIYQTMLSGIIVFAFLILFMSLFIIITKNYSLEQKNIVQTITERQLRESESNFRAFFETMNDLIFISDKQGLILFTNSIVPQKLGYSDEELKTMHILDIHSKHDRFEAEIIFDKMLNGNRSLCPLPLSRKDGSSMPVETRIWFGKWDGSDCVFGVSKDLSKEMEALQKFNKLFDNNPALMAVSKSDGTFSDVNETFIQILGFERHEVIGKSAQSLNLFVESEKLNIATRNMITTGKIHNLELQVRTKSGKTLEGLFSCEVIESQGEKLLLTVMVDITEQKEASRKAQAANRAKSEFLANMSHEIRTPLNGVIGFAELLLQTPLSDFQKQYADNINTSGKALLGIINDILDLSKIEAGKLDLEIIECYVPNVMEQAVDIIKFHAGQKGLELLLNIPPNIPALIMSDPIRLKQILINLLNNAVKFTEHGEVELKVDLEKQNDNFCKFTFSVRDTGIGIAKEQQEKLFKAFSQADSSTTRKFGGTGLGLIISNLLAEKMGSQIEIKSEKGEGSTFSFTINTHCRQSRPKPATKPIPAKTVLVVDDNEHNRIILEHNLVHWGLKFTGCSSGFEALEILKNHSFDVVIVDYHMPDLDGIETIKKIKNNHYSEKFPIIILHSSSDNEPIREHCRKLGVKYNLVKPVKSNELQKLLLSIGNKLEVEIEELQNEQVVESIVISKKSFQIMIAEDVATNRLLLKTIVAGLLPNANIVEAINGAKALEIAVSTKFDLVLMDIQMPEMDGYDATLNIRNVEEGTQQRTPIIALTAGALSEEKEKALKYGMDDFITKPIDRSKLVEIFNKFLLSGHY